MIPPNADRGWYRRDYDRSSPRWGRSVYLGPVRELAWSTPTCPHPPLSDGIGLATSTPFISPAAIDGRLLVESALGTGDMESIADHILEEESGANRDEDTV